MAKLPRNQFTLTYWSLSINSQKEILTGSILDIMFELKVFDDNSMAFALGIDTIYNRLQSVIVVSVEREAVQRLYGKVGLLSVRDVKSYFVVCVFFVGEKEKD